MSRTLLISLAVVAIVCHSAFAQTAGACTTMFNGLKCRTGTQNPSQIDANAVSSARTWLCNSYPQHCSAINSGGAYTSCNNVEQLSYAMNQYYNQFSSQGASACNFGGVGVIVGSATTPAPVVTPAPAASVASAAQCSTMYAQASCRTPTEDATKDAAAITNSRGWLCNVYPQFCLDITNGGSYSSCNSAQQLTYAMSLYYNQFKSQGASACDFSGLAKINGAASTPTPTTAASNNNGVDCSAMWNGLTCRTSSQDVGAVSASGVSGARSWLCSSYPAICTAINSGGTYATCNSVQQISYAMNQYYKQFSYQGSSACNFGGIGNLVGSGGDVVVAPAPAPSTSSKAGLAWPINQFGDGSNPSLAPWSQGKISWIYTWNWDYAPLNIGNLEWVPMLHRDTEANAFIGKIRSGAYDNIKNVLLFNEPDLNYPPYAYGLDVNTAISLSIQVFQAMQQRGKTWRVGAPAMSHNIGWLQQYMSGMAAQCPTCKFSFVPVHCYTLDANAFKGTVTNYYNAFGLPIWVTEFADTDFNSRNWQMSLPDVQKFMSDTTNWLNAQSWVERYSWFGVMRAVDVQDKANMAMNFDGSRNTLGDQYVLRGGSL